MDTTESSFCRLLRTAFLTTWVLATLAVFAMAAGGLSVPITGWGGAYVFAVGLWTLGLAGLGAVILLLGAVLFRARHGRWYFGASDLNSHEER